MTTEDRTLTWVREVIRAGRAEHGHHDLPTYGSTEWVAAGPRARWAAVAFAAEAHRQFWLPSNIAARLAAELDARRRAEKAADDTAYAARARQWRTEWESPVAHPDQQTLDERLAAAHQPRDSDFPGLGDWYLEHMHNLPMPTGMTTPEASHAA
jgi:hypothetical protein